MLFTTHPQEKLSLPIWFTILHMVIEEILSPTACHKLDIYHWLVKIPTFLIDEHKSRWILKVSNVVPSSFSSAITTFSEGLPSSMKP